MSEATKEYGRALSDLAAEEGVEEQLRGDVRAVRALLAENPAYPRLLANPEIPKAERVALLKEAFGGRVHPYLVHFLALLTERGYAYRCTDFLAEYERLYCERHGITVAAVVSAVPLTEDQKRRLTDKLCQVTKKNVTLECSVDPSLIGGIRLQTDNTLFDGSVRARLDALRDRLAALTL